MSAEYRLPDGTIIEIPGAELKGRALDAAVARQLFGLKVEARKNPARTGDLDFVYEVHPGQWVRVAFYSERMGASLEVEYELKKRGWTWRREQRTGSRWSQPGAARVVLDHSGGRAVEGEGATVNEALCRVAIRAVAR